MKVILTSKNQKLQQKFLSNDFQETNFRLDEDYLPTYLDLSVIPIVGSCMYFYDKYYEQIPVIVTNIAYGVHGVMIKCEHANLEDIDSYMYEKNSLSLDFRLEVKHTYEHNKFLLDERCKKTGEDWSKIGSYAREIQKLMNYNERTIIDDRNIFFAICHILSYNYPEVFGVWHRPDRYEYSDY